MRDVAGSVLYQKVCNKLPPEYHILLLVELEKCEHLLRNRLKLDQTSLVRMCTWANTPQGHDFWLGLYDMEKQEKRWP